jgi:hypothetical protein
MLNVLFRFSKNYAHKKKLDFNLETDQIGIIEEIIKTIIEDDYFIRENLQKIYDEQEKYPKENIWDRFCERFDPSDEAFRDNYELCDYVKNRILIPNNILIRYIKEYKDILNFIDDPDTQAIYWKKYLKYKQKYLELKKTLKNI